MATLGTGQSLEKAIFFQALEKASAKERTAYLRVACQGDYKLQRRVEELLTNHFEQDGFMQDPAIASGERPQITAVISEGPGSRIGRYLLLEKIGEGGMGVVYLAAQEEPVRRQVALKIIKMGMDTQQVVARFEAERQALALMDHPNIARVLDAGATETGRPYFVMELVQGIPITEFCNRNGFSVAQRLKLLVPVCQGIQSAHQKGVVHRDLKPTNILVTMTAGVPLPKIIDFGVAKATNQKLTEKTLFTQFATLVGTPAYMSPEQAEMSSLDIDTRADIYSLGILLYELLTGTTPFSEKRLGSASYAEMQRIILEEEPERPSTRLISLNRNPQPSGPARSGPSESCSLSGFSQDLDWIVLKCLEKDRARRYETANGLAMDIQRFLSNEPVLARPPSNLYRFQKFARRNRVAFVMAGFLALVLILATVFSATLAVRALRAERLAAHRLDAEVQATSAAAQAKKQALLDRDDAQRRLFDARVAQAQAARWSGRAGRRFEGLTELAEAAQIARRLQLEPKEILKVRNEAIALLALTDLRLDHKWQAYPPGTALTGIAFDRELERYALVDQDGMIKVRRMADNRQIAVIQEIGAPRVDIREPDWRMTLRFSPNGQYLGASGNLQMGEAPMQVWDVGTSRSVLKLSPGNVWESCAFDFSKDSSLFAAARPDNSVLVCSLPSGEELSRFTLSGVADCVRFNPQTNELAICLGSQVLVMDLEGRMLTGPLAHKGRASMASWSPNGKLLAVGCSDTQTYVWDASTGKLQALCAGHRGAVYSASFHSQGNLLATCGGDEETCLWDPVTGKELLRAKGLSTEFGGQKWLGLGMLGPKVGRWEVASGPEYRQLGGMTGCGPILGLSFSRDGRWLASGAEDGSRLWDTDNGTLAGSVRDRTFSLEFAPGDTSLLACGPSGLCRWSITSDSAGQLSVFEPATRLRIPLPSVGEPRHASQSADGTRVAVTTANAVCVVLSLENPTEEPRILRYPISFAAMSRGGDWVATTTTDDYQAKVWDAHTGACVHDFPGVRTALATFTPDDRWIVFATAQEYRFYQVGSWQAGPCFHRDYAGYASVFPAFSAQGNLAAVARSKDEVTLLDLGSGNELATFAGPGGDELVSLCLSFDGTRLAAGTHNGLIQIWDLSRLRTRLSELGVDWKSSPAAGGNERVSQTN
ncbi:MAG TPA: serine/threonine-protein kinase [Verrucomicrobiae bacterium]|nr:serine/threonine-protein kinase [Verrucomicrobiae bacterium]